MEFSGERYAAHKLQQCNNDQQAFNGPLTIFSLAAAAIVLFLRIRNREYRRFPENIFAMSLGTLCGLHGSMLISTVAESKVVRLQTQPWTTICRIQATLMHWFTCAAVWTVISVIVVLYMIAVRQVPIQLLVKRSKMVYASLVLIPSAAAAACWIFGGYKPFPGLDNCWIHAEIDRFIYFHTFTVLGLGVSAVLGPITVRALWRAYCDASEQSDYARIFRTMLIRQVLLALYGSIMFFVFLLGGVNTLFLKVNPEAYKTSYFKRTAHTYCMLSAVNFSTLGIFVSIIFFSTKAKARELVRATRRLCTRVCSGCDRACDSARNVSTRFLFGFPFERLAWVRSRTLYLLTSTIKPATLVESGSKHELNIFTSSWHLASPRSPGGQLLSPQRLIPVNEWRTFLAWGLYARYLTPVHLSISLSLSLSLSLTLAGQTAFSVPPDPRARNAQQFAATVYTSTLLEYAREQLLDESFASESSSNCSCSSFSSHDSDKRLDEWVSETDFSSSSSSPRAVGAPYLLHGDANARSEVRSAYHNRGIDARRYQERESYTTEL